MDQQVASISALLRRDPNALVRFDQVKIYAAGDRGTGLALDAIEQANRRNGRNGKRHRVTHLFLVDPRDRARFASLGVTADVQMSPSSLIPAHQAFQYSIIGARADALIPTKSLLASNAPVTQISEVRVISTLLAGKPTYDPEQLFQ